MREAYDEWQEALDLADKAKNRYTFMTYWAIAKKKEQAYREAQAEAHRAMASMTFLEQLGQGYDGVDVAGCTCEVCVEA